jgi:hypothetical protein
MNILKRLFRLIFGQKTEPKEVETLVVPQQPSFTSSPRYAGALAPTGVGATVEQPKVEQPKVEVKKATSVAEEPKTDAVVEQKPKPKRKNNYRAKQKKQKKNNENI